MKTSLIMCISTLCVSLFGLFKNTTILGTNWARPAHFTHFVIKGISNCGFKIIVDDLDFAIPVATY